VLSTEHEKKRKNNIKLGDNIIKIMINNIVKLDNNIIKMGERKLLERKLDER
jgi:hypothetical protein